MVDIRLSTQDLLATRFAGSPLIELVISYKSLSNNTLPPTYRRWEQSAREALHGVSFSYLDLLVNSPGYIPDFLTLPPIQNDTTFADELTRVLRTPSEIIRSNIQFLIDVSEESELLQQFMVYPQEMLYCLGEELRLYWQRALAPHWTQMSSVVNGDILYRARQLAVHGTEAMYRDLNPKLTYHPELQLIRLDRSAKPGKPVSHPDEDITGRGLKLVPTIFPLSHIMWQTTPEWEPMLIYGARGIGDWQQQPEHNESLELLLGAGRASVFQALTTPATTSELAHRLMLTAGAVSQHLDRLYRTGLVESRRSGKRVYYHLTERGQQLLLLFDGQYA